MSKRPTFRLHKEEMLRDPEYSAAYEALRPEFELLLKRMKAGKVMRGDKKNERLIKNRVFSYFAFVLLVFLFRCLPHNSLS